MFSDQEPSQVALKESAIKGGAVSEYYYIFYLKHVVYTIWRHYIVVLIYSYISLIFRHTGLSEICI